MVKVTIRRLRAGLTGASGLILLGQADAGCAAPVEHESVGTTGSADTAINPGTGTLTLAPGWGASTILYSFNVAGSVDEYLRVGQVVTFDLSPYDIWESIHPGVSAPSDPSLLTTLTPTFAVQFVGQGDVLGTATSTVKSWNVAAPYAISGTSTPFTIPAGTDTLVIALSIVDATDKSHVELSEIDFQTLPVFGAVLANQAPTKHAIFDNEGSGALRTRIIEGGSLVQTGWVDVALTDWRADEIVQKTLLDTQIGTAENYGRFGAQIIPIYGSVTYEVSVGWEQDQEGWSEWPMSADASPRVLDLPGRTAYETTLGLEDVSTLSLYFHVKAFLQVDYTPYGTSVVSKLYTQGQSVLLKEAWDNANGVPGANYVLPVVPNTAGSP
jgi:hypothetical protein